VVIDTAVGSVVAAQLRVERNTMLKGIDPLLSGDLLKTLDDMGHGDQLLVVDRNYPAYASGRPVVRLGACGVQQAISAILSVFPLDDFVPHPLERMEVEDDPHVVTSTQERVLEIASRAHGQALSYGVISRHDFYDRAKRVYAVAHTLESAPYGCFVLQKGVIFPEGAAAGPGSGAGRLP
jgi:L-fucose mutarotase